MINLTKAQWELVYNSIDEGFCIIEMIFDENKKPIDYRFIKINAPFERQTGLVNAEGKRMRELAPNHEEHWFETYGKIALTGESIRFENRAEQLHRWYDVYAFRFGEPKNFQVAILFNDITKRKFSEDTVKSLNQELEEKVEQLEYANKELEAFSYTVSHDLRTPLRGINGYVNLLKNELSANLNKESAHYLNSIEQCTLKMDYLIQDLLAFSRFSRNEITNRERITEQEVNAIVDEFCIQNSLERSIVKVGKLHPLNGDSSMIKQVWINLLSNAFKYSKKKQEPIIEIGSSLNNNEIEYFIRDNGVGFDMKYYDKLFGIFQRLHGDIDFEGTGIGLAIVKRIIERHGGKVWAEAKENEGATFYFSIPQLG